MALPRLMVLIQPNGDYLMARIITDSTLSLLTGALTLRSCERRVNAQVNRLSHI